MVRLKIFVSSRTDELLEERKAIKSAFSAEIYDVFIFEDSGARTESASFVYKEEVRNCDIYIGIFKEKHSPGTQQEYQLAFQNHKEILIYVAEDIKKQDNKLQKLLKEIRERHKYKHYENTKKLLRSVKRDEDLRNRRFLDARASADSDTDFVVPTMSRALEITKGQIKDPSRKEIKTCVGTIGGSSNDDLIYEIWKRIEHLAKDTRLWKYGGIWNLTSKEILVEAPGKFFNYAVNVLKWILLNAEKDISTYPNAVAIKARKRFLVKCTEILGSTNLIWDFYHRSDFNQILKYVTYESERCAVYWSAWKKCAIGIEDHEAYTRTTFPVRHELEISSEKCKNSIRMERWSLIKTTKPPYLSQRAKNLNI